MSIPIETSEPKLIYAGETMKWTRSLSDYSAADAWQLNYRIQGAQKSIAIAWGTEVSASGAEFAITIPAATSLVYPKLDNLWLYGYVEKDGERKQVYYAKLAIKKSLHADVSGYDGRSHAAKMLAAIEATLEGIAVREEKVIRVNSGGVEKELQFCSTDELLRLRNFYRHELASEVAAENVAAGKASGRRVLSRYRR